MACIPLRVIGKACGQKGTIAGLATCFLISYSDLPTINATSSKVILDGDGVVTGFGAGVTFSEVQFNKSTGGLNETGTFDPTKDIAFLTQNLTFTLGNLNSTNREFVNSVLNQPIAAIVQTRSNKYFLAGENGQLQLSALESGTGTIETDLQGYTLTFSGLSDELIRLVDPLIIDGHVDRA